MGILVPGDTVFMLPGTYYPTATMTLSTSGTLASPITYLGSELGSAIINGSNHAFIGLQITASYIVLRSVQVTNYDATAVLVDGSSNLIRDCYFHHVQTEGILVDGSGNTLFGNLVTHTGSAGIRFIALGTSPRIYNNTVFGCTGYGISLHSNIADGRIINNIAVKNLGGISAKVENTAAFNLTWSNTEGNYTGGVVDSAGGVVVDPLFVDTAAGDFTLQSGSPAINAGLDLGFPYKGSAPDLGAFEYNQPNEAPVVAELPDTSVYENQLLTIDVTAADPENDVLVLTAEDLPDNATFSDHGDRTGLLEFTPDFTQAGEYEILIIASDGELSDTAELEVDVENTNRPPVLTPIGAQSVEEGQTLNLEISAADPDGETPELILQSAPVGASFTDDGDGTGTFSFTPSYTQEGTYDITVMAADGDLSDTELVTITVLPAPISSIAIEPDSAVIEILDSIQFTAAGYDAGGYFVHDLTDSVVWATDDPTGSISSLGLYLAGTDVSPPNYRVTATYSGLADTASVRVISDGALHHVHVEWLDGTPVGNTIATTDNDGMTVYCRGYDIADVLLGDIVVTWSWSGGGVIGSLTPVSGTSSSLTLTTPGSDAVVATYSAAIADTSGLLTVAAGLPTQLDVSPYTATVSVDSSIDFSAVSRDADGNVSDPQIVPQWTVLDGIGNMDAVGVFSPTTVGSGYIVASSGGEGTPICPTDLVHYWPLNKTTGPPYPDIDEGDDATCVDCPASIAGLVGMSLDFDGDTPGEYLTAPSADGLTAALTVMAWIRPDNIALLRDRGIVGRSSAFALEIDALSNGIRFTTTDGSDVHSFAPNSLSNSISALTWTHVAATFDGSTVALYINGQLIDSDPAQVSVLGGGTQPYTIGWTSGSRYFDGRIDEVAIFDRALTTFQIQQHYDRGTDHDPLCETVVLGISDTSGVIQVIPGALASIELSPDSALVSADSTLQYTVEGFDVYGNLRDPGTISYSLTGPVGQIDASGLFTASVVGTARAVAESDLGPTDTTASLEVVPGGLQRLEIAPPSIAVRIGDTVQFTITGYDADSNATDVGSIDWRALGRVGTINDSGLFVATSAGKGKVAAVSSLAGVADTSDFVDVDEIVVSAIALGSSYVRPGEIRAPLLSLSFHNYFADDRAITGLMVRDATRGPGSAAERLTNIDSVAVYLDSDSDSLLTPADSLLDWAAYSSTPASFAFAPLVIPSDSQIVLLVGGAVNLFSRDSDSLDLYCSRVDITTADATVPAGPDSLNSLGVSIVDGLVAAQLRFSPTSIDSLEPSADIYHVMTVDIPRNGYQADTLQMFSLASLGTSGPNDFDSLSLFLEEVNATWDEAASEHYVGRMYFTGDRWTVTGLNVPLVDPNTRFYVGASVAAFPTNGATLIPYVPVNGIQVVSGNDGPVDLPTAAIDTFAITTFEALSVIAIPVAGGELIPGQESDAMLAARITNTYSSAVVVDSVEFALAAVDHDGATQDQLDSQIDSVFLFITRSADNSSVLDSLVATATLTNGVVKFATGGLTIAGNGGALTVALSAAISLRNAKNGNTIGFMFEDGGHIWCTPGVAVAGTFPITNSKTFTVNAFPAAAVIVNTLAGRSLFGGQVDQMVLDFELPRNGYDTDALYQVRVINRGTVDEIVALDNMKLWADNGSGTFSAASVLVGQFTFDGLSWALSAGLYPLLTPTTRFYITVSVAADNREGGTLDLEIPHGLIGYISGTVGPDDEGIANPHTHLIFQSNRVTAIALPDPGSVVAPGQNAVSLLTLALYNGYVGRAQTLRSVSLSNRTVSWSDQDFADSELGQVRLYFDNNRNRIFDGDTLVSTGSFKSGALDLTGIDIPLPPESLSYFFAIADVPLNAIDGDSLAVSVDNTADLAFAVPVTINGDFPLQSGGFRTVDGSVRAQYHAPLIEARSLRPGDTLVPVFAMTPAVNGDQPDVLESLVVENLQSAADTDFDRLTLWLDTNADSAWQAGDSLLGTLVGSSGSWSLGSIDLPVSAPAPVLFVLCDVSLTATPGAALKLSVPVNGCTYESANDGPRDEALITDNTFVVSTSGLRISNVPVNSSYSVGQTIAIATTVTNVLNLPMDSVFGICTVNGPAALDSAFSGPVPLGIDEQVTFTFFYTAQAPGAASWELSAYEPTIPDSSAVVRTAETALQAPAYDVPLHFINSTPTAVTKGQTNVFPLSIEITHPDSSDTTAAVELAGLTISVTDASGQPQDASDAFSRMVLSSGYTTLSAIEVVPAQSAVTFTFTQPIVVVPGDSRLLSLLVDISDSATAHDFALRLDSPSSVPVADHNTELPVTLSPTLTFPISTASCRIDEPSEQMAVSYRSLAPATVNFGQDGVALLQVHLRHPGALSSSQIQLTALTVSFVDETLQEIPASEICTRLSIVRNQTVIGEASGLALDSAVVSVILVSPVTVSPGELDSIRLVIDAAADAPAIDFAMHISDSTRFVVRDLSSGAPLTAVSDDAPLATAVSGFPILSSLASFRQAAVAPQACLTPAAYGSVIAGSDSIALLGLTIHYAAGDMYSPQQLTGVTVRITDSLDTPLDPASLFDRVGLSTLPGTVAYMPTFQQSGDYTLFAFPDGAVTINPGDSLQVALIADIESDTPVEHLVIRLHDEADVILHDVSDTSSHTGVVVSPGCGESIPYVSPAIRILQPAGRPVLATQTGTARLVPRGQVQVPLYTATLTYDGSTPQGDLLLHAVCGRLMSRDGAGFHEVPAVELLNAVHLNIDGDRVATDSILSGDSLMLAVPGGYTIAQGADVDIVLLGDIRPDAPLGNFAVQLADSNAVSLADQNLATTIYPLLVQAAYPLLGAEISVTAGGLEESFTNYPNPFNAASGEETTIGFVLPEAAYVDIELFTITGAKVLDITRDDYRVAGAYSQDRWDGRNDAGLDVVPGTYFCRITARYVSGGTESVRRKVAILR
jgi:parallel beta-helix repeat protein